MPDLPFYPQDTIRYQTTSDQIRAGGGAARAQRRGTQHKSHNCAFVCVCVEGGGAGCSARIAHDRARELRVVAHDRTLPRRERERLGPAQPQPEHHCESTAHENALVVLLLTRGSQRSAPFLDENTKYQIPNTKYQIPNTKYQIPNTCDTGQTRNKLLEQWVHLTNHAAAHSRPGTTHQTTNNAHSRANHAHAHATKPHSMRCAHATPHAHHQLAGTHTRAHTQKHTQTHPHKKKKTPAQTHTQKHTQTHRTNTHTHKHTHTHTHTRAHAHTHTKTHTNTPAHTKRKHPHKHTHKNTHKHTAQTHTHTQTHTNTHTHLIERLPSFAAASTPPGSPVT